MIDANSQFFAILTNVGMAKQANADALGIPWKITDMGVGDANDTDPIPNAAQTRLINEWRRRPLNQLRVDPVNPAVIIAEQIIPADEGGHWIREIGLYDADGDLVAVANCAPSFKPVLSQGSGRTQVVRMNFIVSSTGNITLKIDPAVVLATREYVGEYVDQRIMEELYKLDSKQSVRLATTANIALAGLQPVDGVALVAGDRVLVKNQTAAKDNGLYVAAAGVWARAVDADTNAEVTSALLVSVEQGSTLADTRWQLVTDGVIVLGSTALVFQNVTQGFAPINSPAFSGTPTVPTPPRFDKSLLVANAEFVQLSKGGYSGYAEYQAASGSIPVTDIGKYIGFNSGGAQSYSLPDASTLPLGVSFYIEAVGPSSVLTLTAPNTTFTGVAAQAPSSSFKLRDSACEFIVIGNSYRVVGGGGKSLTTRNGYERRENGLIYMWGDGVAGGSTAQASFGSTITKSVYNNFPIPFPVELFGVVATHCGAGSASVTIVTNGETVSGFYAAASYGVDTSFRYRAVGK
ncbi:phage tail protein [Pseudomonas chlororaphis]|uniref:phage tail protein n=1 Tax=Pseudomonas chlororaphis TaxID=587753 RepID=UPI00131F7F9A|nr:phage tail protein [Pseudomonas chlororaphis]QHC88706.1 phage tail protein [Pseudomonas chlororaphis]